MSTTAASAAVPGQRRTVQWRDPREAKVLGWVDAYGPGPFEVIRAVDLGGDGLLLGLVLKTKRGEQEVNEAWLSPVDESDKDTEVL
jgi:hypothetical protein